MRRTGVHADPHGVPIKAAIFDLDDTLIWTYRTAYLRSRAAMSRLGLPELTEERFRLTYGKHPFPECSQKWHPDIEVNRFLDAYRGSTVHFPYEAIVDISNLFETFDRLGVWTGILTNSSRSQTVAKLRDAGFIAERLGNRLFCFEDLLQPKPSGRAFSALLEHTGWRPEEHIYFGDAHSDRMAAESAGLRFIGVRTGPHPVACPTIDIAALVKDLTASSGAWPIMPSLPVR